MVERIERVGKRERSLARPRRTPVVCITEIVDPWRSVADALAHTKPEDRVEVIEPRPELDI
ncbi:MAG: hypothetical protein G01um10145_913 [Microgenomates group bacterium Gr01-1014_5]|nr:MAG: hypothetical protein G01um10145_913 [Microgenomates group bacterium Gr01-1014_5]